MPSSLESLARVPLLQDLSEEQLAFLAERTRSATFRAGEPIIEIGQPGRSLYLVISGEVQVVYPSRSAEFELARLGAGDFIGEMALLDDKPRSATVRALCDVETVVLDQDDFRRALAENHGMAMRLLGVLSTRIRQDAELIGSLSEQAMRDPLTRMLNRRAFQERLVGEVDRQLRYETDFSLVVLDLDHFKNINDSLGHTVGDEILKWLGQALGEHTRAADTSFRIGGEEFAVLCPSTDATHARQAAERIVNVVAGARAPAGHGVVITLSAGYASCPEHGTHADELLRAADGALLRAKQAGRNRVGDPKPDPGD